MKKRIVLLMPIITLASSISAQSWNHTEAEVVVVDSVYDEVYVDSVADYAVADTSIVVDVNDNQQGFTYGELGKYVSDVDKDIPFAGGYYNKNTFVVIIANQNYQRESDVDFALNDGDSFADYCNLALGIPESNIHLIKDGTLNHMIYELDWLNNVCTAYDGDASVIFYYAGHGVPNESDGNPFLLPVDGSGKNMRTCYGLDELYSTLGTMPAKQIIVFMDACFSGSKRNGEILTSARGVAIKAKQGVPKGKLIILSAAQGDETAYSYREEGHGLFTYFLLKKLKETKGNATLEELARYVKTQVRRHSIVENEKSQTPSISYSSQMENNWRQMKLK